MIGSKFGPALGIALGKALGKALGVEVRPDVWSLGGCMDIVIP